MPDSAVQGTLGFAPNAIEAKATRFVTARDCELYRKLDRVQESYAYADETKLFAKLVNMSSVSSKPFHRWARYREGFNPGLVIELLQRSEVDLNKDYVFDPMCGSGTTVRAANDIG
jgi:site-specific DNA-methyltransferase (adenine-specific)